MAWYWWFLIGYLFIGTILGLLSYFNYEYKRYFSLGDFLFALICWGPALILLCYVKIADTLEKLRS